MEVRKGACSMGVGRVEGGTMPGRETRAKPQKRE